jgi:hypothetical protein
MRRIGAVADLSRSCRFGSVRWCNPREQFPAGWKDPLELYGGFRAELARPEFDAESERRHVSRLIQLRGAGWVWSNRHRLVSLRKLVSRAESRRFTRRPVRGPACEVCHGATL